MWWCAAAPDEMNCSRQHPSHLIEGKLSWEWQVTRDHSNTLSGEHTWGLLEFVTTKCPHMTIYFHQDTHLFLVFTVRIKLTLNDWVNTVDNKPVSIKKTQNFSSVLEQKWTIIKVCFVNLSWNLTLKLKSKETEERFISGVITLSPVNLLLQIYLIFCFFFLIH